MLKVLILGLAFVGGMAVAHADDACKADREKLCPAASGPREIMKCMREHKDQVTDACKAEWKGMKAEMKEAREACHDDVEKFCNGMKVGGGRIMKCLHKHKDELSQACKDEFAKMKEKHGK